MLIKKIINWFENKDDVTADIAKSNNKFYQYQLEERRRDYIKSLCKQIKIESLKGSKCIITADLQHEIMSYDFMMELKEYFEQRGFNVEEKSNRCGVLTSWLRISWE